jgi:hypothetical protein
LKKSRKFWKTKRIRASSRRNSGKNDSESRQPR